MNGPIQLILLIVYLYAYFGSFWLSNKDDRRHAQTVARILAICFAFSLVWAAWK